MLWPVSAGGVREVGQSGCVGPHRMIGCHNLAVDQCSVWLNGLFHAWGRITTSSRCTVLFFFANYYLLDCLRLPTVMGFHKEKVSTALLPRDGAAAGLPWLSARQLHLIRTSPAIFGGECSSFDWEWRTPAFITHGEKAERGRRCVLLLFLCTRPSWQWPNPFANLISGQCTKFQCLINWALDWLSRPHHQHFYYS